MASFPDRVIGALQLKPQTFEDVEHDQSATVQAATVVAMAGVSGALAHFSLSGLVSGVVLQLLGWAIGAFVLLIVGTKLLPGKNTEADFGQMLRTAGFAQAPGLFMFLTRLPLIGYLILLVLLIWNLVALLIAVRQALDYEDTSRALATCAVAVLIMWIVSAAAALLGVGAATVASGGL